MGPAGTALSVLTIYQNETVVINCNDNRLLWSLLMCTPDTKT